MEGIEALMRHVYVFVPIGLILGAIFGAAAFISSKFLPSNLTAVLVLIAIYKLCGINHIDGLADFGDGVIAHGSIEKKVQAMKDVHLGTGGGVFIALILLTTFSTISEMPMKLLPLALIASEVCAKQSMITFAAFSRSLQRGFGQMMIEKTRTKHFIIGLAISAILCFVTLGPLGMAALISTQAAALYLIHVSNKNFGGSTGDGIGASNEICRTTALAIFLALGGVLPWMPW